MPSTNSFRSILNYPCATTAAVEATNNIPNVVARCEATDNKILHVANANATDASAFAHKQTKTRKTFKSILTSGTRIKSSARTHTKTQMCADRLALNQLNWGECIVYAHSRSCVDCCRSWAEVNENRSADDDFVSIDGSSLNVFDLVCVRSQWGMNRFRYDRSDNYLQ